MEEIQGQRFLAGAPFGHHAAGLHGGGDEALAGDALVDDDIGIAEGLFGIAAFLVEGEGDVVGPLGMHGGGARGEGLFGIGDGRECLVVDFDEVGGVARDVAVRGDDDGDGMADVVDAVLGEEVVMRHAQAGEGRGAGHGAEMLDVLAGEDGGDAGRSRAALVSMLLMLAAPWGCARRWRGACRAS